jgi:hypothetical protein
VVAQFASVKSSPNWYAYPAGKVTIGFGAALHNPAKNNDIIPNKYLILFSRLNLAVVEYKIAEAASTCNLLVTRPVESSKLTPRRQDGKAETVKSER